MVRIQHHTPRGYLKDDGLIFKQVDNWNLLCIPGGSHSGYTFCGFFIWYAYTLLAHLGFSKYFLFLQNIAWWPSNQEDIKAYCKQCHICTTGRSRTHKAWGLLHPLLVSSHAWEQIGIDIVGPLPLSTNCLGSFDMICVIIDHLTSTIHLVASRQDYSANKIAEIVFEHIYKLHGMPDQIISNSDSVFTVISGNTYTH